MRSGRGLRWNYVTNRINMWLKWKNTSLVMATLFYSTFFTISDSIAEKVAITKNNNCVAKYKSRSTVMAAIELYTPQGAEKVSGMIYEPDEQG